LNDLREARVIEKEVQTLETDLFDIKKNDLLFISNAIFPID
jgi:hypothetical protein